MKTLELVEQSRLTLILLIPFWRFKIPNKKYLPSLIAFSISMGVMVYVFMTLSLYHSSIISPVIVGSQLAIPFGVLLSGIMLAENIARKKGSQTVWSRE